MMRRLRRAMFGGSTAALSTLPFISAPGLTWTGDAADATPDFDVEFSSGLGSPLDAAANDVLRLEYSTDGGSNWNAYLTHTMSSGEIAGDPITVSGVSALSSGSYLFRARLERGTILSAWSDNEAAILVIVAVAAGIGWPWLWIPTSGSSTAGQPTGPWLWLLQG